MEPNTPRWWANFSLSWRNMGKFFTPASVLILGLASLCTVYYLGERYIDTVAKPCSCQGK